MPYQKRALISLYIYIKNICTNFIIYTYAISKTWIHYFHYIYLCHIKNMDTLISLYIPMPYQKHGYTNFIIYTYAISKT